MAKGGGKKSSGGNKIRGNRGGKLIRKAARNELNLASGFNAPEPAHPGGDSAGQGSAKAPPPRESHSEAGQASGGTSQGADAQGPGPKPGSR